MVAIIETILSAGQMVVCILLSADKLYARFSTIKCAILYAQADVCTVSHATMPWKIYLRFTQKKGDMRKGRQRLGAGIGTGKARVMELEMRMSLKLFEL